MDIRTPLALLVATLRVASCAEIQMKDVGVDGALRGPGGMLVILEYVAYVRGKFMPHDVVLYARLNNEESSSPSTGTSPACPRPSSRGTLKSTRELS